MNKSELKTRIFLEELGKSASSPVEARENFEPGHDKTCFRELLFQARRKLDRLPRNSKIREHFSPARLEAISSEIEEKNVVNLISKRF